MLDLFAMCIDDSTGLPRYNNKDAALTGCHFEYGILFQPQPALQSSSKGSAAGEGGMNFQMDYEAFMALHSMLAQIKAAHLRFLDGMALSGAGTEVSGESDGLCFSSIYWATIASSREDGAEIKPQCPGIEVYVRRGGERVVVGFLTLRTPLDCIAGLILEAERIHALIHGEPEENVLALKKMQLQRPAVRHLRLVSRAHALPE